MKKVYIDSEESFEVGMFARSLKRSLIGKAEVVNNVAEANIIVTGSASRASELLALHKADVVIMNYRYEQEEFIERTEKVFSGRLFKKLDNLL